MNFSSYEFPNGLSGFEGGKCSDHKFQTTEI